MPTAEEEAEMAFNRLRMEDAKRTEEFTTSHLSQDHSDSESDDTVPKPPPSPPLDDTISAEEARALKEEGNALYKSAKYEASIPKYSRAASSAHASDDDRAVYLANRAAAHLKLQKFDKVVEDASLALKLRPGYVKALARRREAREAMKEWRGALEDATELKHSASDLRRLQFLADEKDKRDRDQALESLKGLGNTILSNFGMSMDDISMEKDPNTGSYSIKMSK